MQYDWLVPSMRLQVILDSFPAWVQAHFQSGARGSPGTGLPQSMFCRLSDIKTRLAEKNIARMHFIPLEAMIDRTLD